MPFAERGALPRTTGSIPWNLSNSTFAREIHPVDVIEQVAHNNDWAFERAGDDEISISVAGSWTDYHVSFSWMEDFEALHLACAFDIKVPEARALEVMRLLSLINEQMLFGHFDLWEQEGAIMFRQSLLLAGGVEPTSQQVEVLLSSALEACECYFQAFQFVVWSGTSAKDALAERAVRDATATPEQAFDMSSAASRSPRSVSRISTVSTSAPARSSRPSRSRRRASRHSS